MRYTNPKSSTDHNAGCGRQQARKGKFHARNFFPVPVLAPPACRDRQAGARAPGKTRAGRLLQRSLRHVTAPHSSSSLRLGRARASVRGPGARLSPSPLPRALCGPIARVRLERVAVAAFERPGPGAGGASLALSPPPPEVHAGARPALQLARTVASKQDGARRKQKATGTATLAGCKLGCSCVHVWANVGCVCVCVWLCACLPALGLALCAAVKRGRVAFALRYGQEI